jgi:excisionase family DNA binding protein
MTKSLREVGIEKREFLSVSQLAKLLKISRVAVLKRINRGAIKAVKVGPNFVIKKQDIKHLLRNINKEKAK